MESQAELPAITETEALVIKSFVPTREKVDAMVAANSELVFDYASRKGNKEARSHISNLRTLRADVERCRKQEKESALSYGRLVDSTAKSLTESVTGMIEVHAEPLKKIEDAEAARQDILNGLAANPAAMMSEISEIEAERDRISDMVIPDCAECEAAKKFRLEQLAEQVIAAQKRDDDAQELERLRNAEAERVEKAAEEKRLADEKAQAEADEKAQAERNRILREEAAAEAKAEAEAAAEEARLELIRAVEEAEQARVDAIAETERQRVAAEEEKEAAKAEAAEAFRKAEATAAEALKTANAETERLKKAEADRVERDRQAIETSNKIAAERKANFEANRKKLIKQAADELAAGFGWSAENALKAATSIADGKFPSIKLVTV